MQFGFGKKKVRLEEEDEDNVTERKFTGEDGTAKSSPSPMKVCIQTSLVCVSLVILFFGVAVTLTGLWSHESLGEYMSITDSPPKFTRLPVSAMVTGIFVGVLALIGLVGSICFRTITGQTLLGVFTFVLVLVIISELGAGVTGVMMKLDLEDMYTKSILHSQMNYIGDNSTSQPSTATQWDKFQEKHECCGAKGYVSSTPPYYQVFGNSSVPTSCCRNSSSGDCKSHAGNATKFRDYIYETGCAKAVIATIEENVIIVAIVSIVAGSFQLLAVIFALCLLYCSSKLKQKRTFQYSILRREEDKSSRSL